MTLFSIESRTWGDAYEPSVTDGAVAALEGGRVLFLPRLAFELQANEGRFLDPATVHGGKNVSYNPANGKVGGTAATDGELEALRAMLARFSSMTDRLVRALLPAYASGIELGRTSLRPVEIAGRVTSWRADDTRLHVDAFPSMPTRGKRILRVFSNINPAGQPRVWKVGGSFGDVAQRFQPSLRPPVWGSHAAMLLVRMTKALRSPYDHYMLQLHDRMKADAEYQGRTDHSTHQFPSGSTWLVYTDQVPHAALSGVHQLEQTFYVPVACLRNEASAPVRVLEQLMARKLA